MFVATNSRFFLSRNSLLLLLQWAAWKRKKYAGRVINRWFLISFNVSLHHGLNIAIPACRVIKLIAQTNKYFSVQSIKRCHKHSRSDSPWHLRLIKIRVYPQTPSTKRWVKNYIMELLCFAFACMCVDRKNLFYGHHTKEQPKNYMRQRMTTHKTTSSVGRAIAKKKSFLDTLDTHSWAAFRSRVSWVTRQMIFAFFLGRR